MDGRARLAQGNSDVDRRPLYVGTPTLRAFLAKTKHKKNKTLKKSTKNKHTDRSMCINKLLPCPLFSRQEEPKATHEQYRNFKSAGFGILNLIITAVFAQTPHIYVYSATPTYSSSPPMIQIRAIHITPTACAPNRNRKK